MNKREIDTLTAQVSALTAELDAARREHFPHGAAVNVHKAPSYTGPGHADWHTGDGCAIDKIPVKLENGNTRWYPTATVNLAESLKP